MSTIFRRASLLAPGLCIALQGCPLTGKDERSSQIPEGACEIQLGRYYDECEKSFQVGEGEPLPKEEAVLDCKVFAISQARCVAQAMACPTTTCTSVDPLVRAQCGDAYVSECSSGATRMIGECQYFHVDDSGTGTSAETIRNNCLSDLANATCLHDCMFDSKGTARSCAAANACYAFNCESNLGVAPGAIDLHHPCPSPDKEGAQPAGEPCLGVCEVAAGWSDPACTQHTPYAHCLQACAQTWATVPQCVSCLQATASTASGKSCDDRLASMARCRLDLSCGGDVLYWLPAPH